MTITIINFHNYTLTRWALHYDWLILSPTVAGGSPGGPLDHALQSTWSWYNHLHGHGWWDGEETTLTVNNMEWTLTTFIRCNLLPIHINVDMSNSRGIDVCLYPDTNTIVIPIQLSYTDISIIMQNVVFVPLSISLFRSGVDNLNYWKSFWL